MNIFVLDTDVRTCARYHNDRHCVKMILETTQLLNNALIVSNDQYKPCYRETHRNHPASIWTRESVANFKWLNKLGLELCDEYNYRYGKIHKCYQYLIDFDKYCTNLPDKEQTPFKLCMPDLYKSVDAVSSYRKYYMSEKRHIASWKNREIPHWWK